MNFLKNKVTLKRTVPYTGGGRSMVQKRGLSMVQKRGVSMVQLFDFRQLFFGKGVSRWYSEIFKKIFLVNMTGFF